MFYVVFLDQELISYRYSLRPVAVLVFLLSVFAVTSPGKPKAPSF